MLKEAKHNFVSPPLNVQGFSLKEIRAEAAEDYLFFTEKKGWAAVLPRAVKNHDQLNLHQLTNGDVIVFTS